MSIFNKFYNAKIKLYENVIGSKPQPGVVTPKATAPVIAPKTTTPAPAVTPNTTTPAQADPANPAPVQTPSFKQALDAILASDLNNPENKALLNAAMAQIQKTQPTATATTPVQQ